MHWVPKFQYASRSDTGMKRQNNEDACIIAICPEDVSWESRGHLFVVADGMGGHEVGELASKTAISTIPHVFFKSQEKSAAAALKEAMLEANTAINDLGTKNREFNRMGTTCSSLLINAEGFIVGHVGDSRIYRVREERVDQLTFDHTVAWEQKLRQKNQNVNQVDAEKYGHVLTRCLGPEAEVAVDIEGPFQYLPGDVYLLCSDGVTKYLSDIELGIIAKYLPPSEAVRCIVNLANLRGGGDNSTVVAVRISKQDGSIAPPPTQEYYIRQVPPVWAQPLLILLTVAAGVGAGFLSYYQWAVLAACLGLLGTVFLLGAFVVNRERSKANEPEPEEPEDASSTIFFRPYRTAAIRLNEDSLEKFREATFRLQATARDNHWSCDWKQVQEHQKMAEQAGLEQKFRQALMEWSKTIEMIFSGMPR